MVLDGLRGYLQLATGLTDVTRERARAAARTVVAQGGAGVDAVVPDQVKSQVSTLTDDLLAASKANRDLLLHLVRAEVERSVARLGLVSKAELDAERRRADRLEAKVRELETKVPPAPRSATKKSAAKKSAATKSAAKKSAATTSAETTTTAATPATPATGTTAPAAGGGA
jgi:polyhydroxyalkanoate synthesis regulator phasin